MAAASLSSPRAYRIAACVICWAFGFALVAANPGAASDANAGADLSGTESCVSTAVEAQRPPGDCLMELHAPCMAFPPNSKALATLCFVNTRKNWDARIKERLSTIAKTAAPRIASIANIESRYDLLSNLLQCDRLDELSALYQTADEDRLLQKKRCEAAAAGLAYIRLLVRSETLK
ncbi:hypothetical protein [Roseibium aggregatum]|uniref:Uncharacterized protein n=1 Tax=Roseibium aggregatum TaxID=187304 RepID=A0A926NVX9_9HYPH|nr:hypothetical protein [Roseibium aggregatum]MBD1545371.1 hypothetical protein [Roseibium aggregatum]